MGSQVGRKAFSCNLFFHLSNERSKIVVFIPVNTASSLVLETLAVHDRGLLSTNRAGD
jgi:hypothetical protein